MNNCSGCFLPPLQLCLSLFPELPTPAPAKSQTWPWPSASHIWHRQQGLPAPRRKGPGGRRTGRGGSCASVWARRPVQGARAPGADLPLARVSRALENSQTHGRWQSGCACPQNKPVKAEATDLQRTEWPQRHLSHAGSQGEGRKMHSQDVGTC